MILARISDGSVESVTVQPRWPRLVMVWISTEVAVIAGLVSAIPKTFAPDSWQTTLTYVAIGVAAVVWCVGTAGALRVRLEMSRSGLVIHNRFARHQVGWENLRTVDDLGYLPFWPNANLTGEYGNKVDATRVEPDPSRVYSKADSPQLLIGATMVPRGRSGKPTRFGVPLIEAARQVVHGDADELAPNEAIARAADQAVVQAWAEPLGVTCPNGNDAVAWAWLDRYPLAGEPFQLMFAAPISWIATAIVLSLWLDDHWVGGRLWVTAPLLAIPIMVMFVKVRHADVARRLLVVGTDGSVWLGRRGRRWWMPRHETHARSELKHLGVAPALTFFAAGGFVWCESGDALAMVTPVSVDDLSD